MGILFEAYNTVSGSVDGSRHKRAYLSDMNNVVAAKRQPRVVLTADTLLFDSLYIKRRPSAYLSDMNNVVAAKRQPQAVLAESLFIPTANIIYGARGVFSGLSAQVTTHATINSVRTKRAFLSNLSAGVFGARTKHSYLSDGLITYNRTALLLQQPSMYATTVEGINVTLYSAFGITSDAHISALIYRLQTVLGLRAGLQAPYREAFRLLSARVQLVDAIASARRLQLANTFGVGSTLSESELRLVALADSLALAAGLTDTQLVDRVLAVVLALGDSVYAPILELLTTSFGLHDAVQDSVEAYAAALSAMRLAVVSQGGALLSTVVSDAFVLSDALSDTVEKLVQLASTVGLMFTFGTGDEAYTAWVMDAESKAAWTYDNYPFNSFCQLGDRYLAAGPGGIFALGGTLDNAVDIQWKLRTGLLNFGATTKKRIDRVYVGYTTAGTVGLSVITTAPDGEKVQYNYTMTTHTANVPTNDRIKVGRGLDSVYFAFEFSGTGDFSLSDAKVLPMITTRRV